MRILLRAWIVAAAMTAASCQETPATVAVAAAPVPALGSAAGMPHGDHKPHHGGTVYMYGEVHYEVVLDGHGHHRIYFTDAIREDLPASVASQVTLTIQRPTFTPELLRGTIDEQGESWMLEGAPVTQANTMVRVSFVVNGESYWIDVPFITPAATSTPTTTSTQ